MTCPQCAFENPPAMAFCGRCGTRLASLCPSCGFANPEGFASCGSTRCRPKAPQALLNALLGEDRTLEPLKQTSIARTDHPFSLTMAYRGLGSLYCVQGDFDRAIPVLERGLALSRDSNMTLLSPTVMGWLGYAYAIGRGAESPSLSREAVASIESMGIGAFHALRCLQLGEAYLLTDRVEDALALASRLLVGAGGTKLGKLR